MFRAVLIILLVLQVNEFNAIDLDTGKPRVFAGDNRGALPTNGRAPLLPAWEEVFPQGNDVPDVACGRNCLYIWLRSRGSAITRSELEAAMPLGREGASLGQIQRIARSFGLMTEPRLVKPEEFPDGPCIARLDSEGDLGHFIFVIDRRKNGTIEAVDGTTENVILLSAVDIAEVFSGYVIVPNEERAWLSWTTLNGLLSLILAAQTTHFFYRLKTNRS